MAKLSVVITVFNLAPYIKECIESVRNQTLQDLEIILVDDGSTDESPPMCDYYAKADKRVQVIHKENGGAMSARKIGAERSNSPYLIFVDGDDWIEADYYKTLYNAMVESDVDVVIAGHVNKGWGQADGNIGHGSHLPGIYREGDLNKNFYGRLIYDGSGYFQWGISPSLCDKLMKRESVMQYLNDVDERIWDGDDACCIYPFLLNVTSVCIIEQYGYHHRRREKSLCHIHDFGYFERLKILEESLLNAVQGHEYEKIVLPQIKRYVYEMALKNVSVIYDIPLQLKQEQYLFPFGQVEKGSKIVLYGAGKVGQEFYRQVMHENYAEVVLWVDQRAEEMGDERVSPVESICNAEYQYLVIALGEKTITEEVKQNMHIEYGLSFEKIISGIYH